MIRKLIRQMLIAQILSALTVSLCLLIDNIMIGRFLGEEALAAKLADFKRSLKAKVAKANEELSKIEYKFKTN